MPAKNALLFESLKVRELELLNRIMISPMCTYQAELDGKAHETHLVHYGQFALGGAGLIMTEATAVEARGRISAGDLGLWSDEQVPAIKRVVDFVHQQGSKMGVQLAHAGIKASTRPPWDGNSFLDNSDAEKGAKPWQTVGPTDEPLAADWPTPMALSISDIETLVEAWGAAAARANTAGFDVLEIHGAHGYLISEFLSPLTNTRTDEYGGEQGRTRLACEVVEAVRANWPEHKPLFFRMSVIEGVDIGWSLDDSIKLAKRLKTLGVDLIDCSSGGVIGMHGKYAIPRTPGYQVFLADAIRSQARIQVSAVGLITQPNQAEAILQASQTDIIALGREALNNPYWPRHAAQVFNADEHFENWPQRYGWWLDKRAAMVKGAGQ
ncbi:MAG: NADH:flavin oxidoreductase / NADH oxidase [Cycloclasticus sp.]|nr:MAG: NADH:flavin oxidoreductase / NADH oxidase [Cycloclasticus sp.]